MGLLLLITIFIIYIILGILYESFIHPVTILTGLPFAAFGALFALWLAHVELGVYGYVGIIMLIGIVEKNAIMMIDFALERQRTERNPPAKAIVEAASVRFRPIMMTTVSAIVGTLPIAIGVGTSAASRRPLGVAVVGGLAFSQIVTLYVTPVFYSYFDELQAWLGRRARSAVSSVSVEPVPAAGDLNAMARTATATQLLNAETQRRGDAANNTPGRVGAQWTGFFVRPLGMPQRARLGPAKQELPERLSPESFPARGGKSFSLRRTPCVSAPLRSCSCSCSCSCSLL